jgi:hypothetical protein
VIEEQIRRGRRVAQGLGDGPRRHHHHHGHHHHGHHHDREDWEPGYGEPGSGYDEQPWGGSDPFRLLGMPMRHLDRLVREILRQIRSARPDPFRLAGLLVQLQIEAFSEITRLGFGAFGAGPRWGDAFQEDVHRVQHDIDEGLHEIEEEEEYETYEAEQEEEEEELADEPWEWPAAPSAPTVIRASVPIPVYVWSHERTEIALDLPPGAQSQHLAVEPPLAVGTGEPPAPAFEADFVALADGPMILRVEVPRELPAGLYPRRIVTRATREPVGTLTVQVGTLPMPSGEMAP